MLRRPEGPGHTIGLTPQGINAGKGFVFVSHLGEVYPNGFLRFRRVIDGPKDWLSFIETPRTTHAV